MTNTGPIRVRVPGRVNLIGDHTDYTGGLAMPMAIDRWTMLTGQRGEAVMDLTSAQDPERVQLSLPLTIEPAAVQPLWGRFVAGIVSEMQPGVGLRGHIDSNIPVGAGLSSSAALGIAVALGLGWQGAPTDLATLAQRAENRATGVPTGIMDQLCILTAVAGHASMIDCSHNSVVPVAIPDSARIAVVFVAHRTLDGSPYAQRVAQCAAAEKVIGSLTTADVNDVVSLSDPLLQRRARHVISENRRVRAFAEALQDQDLATAGRLMMESHHSLREDYEVSTPEMDRVVQELTGIPGVYGARLTGGGFGGCVVALCQPGVDIPGAWWVKPVGRAEVL